MRHLLVFAHQRGRSDLGNHQAGIKARLAGKEGGQAEGEGGINQKRDATLRNSADFTNRKRNLVGGKGNRLSMEIAARYGAPIRKHERIVGHGIGFDFQCACGLAQNIETGTVNLRLAAVQ